MKLLHSLFCTGTAMLLAACTAPTQQQAARLGLRLPPAALGASISLQQHLSVEREGRTDHLDAALEIDEDHVGLIGLAMGQRVMSLNYDGKVLKTWRHALLPAPVRGEDVLEDIQLTYWPADSIRAALPPGWRIEDHGRRRTLWSGDTPVAIIEYSAEPRWSGKVLLSNLRYHYRLTIQSVPNGQ
ncbi:DUF3261 domain-containing protein [Noviherbaspirillum saxi]|uniref:DUF3261 domain-containing protein n=1 Tax=Noviherbaspirillum saxi TaxID=2320863 RepID=A0A3A3G507_9BURK|nr:DUF3261 domain-containing protein [Noviherbaspirillum saxi]RJF97215.1 DUF3261 domain-containing protein [Noviherbaspirillum saxi]